MKSWIARFKPHEGVVCPGFWRLRHLAQCPHGCAYCYLQTTFWRIKIKEMKWEKQRRGRNYGLATI